MIPLPIQITLLGLILAITGCGPRAVEMDNPIPIAAEEYNRVFEATISVLELADLSVVRQDRRFGVIKTAPRTSGSWLEPWRDDNTTFYQTTDATLNHQRRTVTVLMAPDPLGGYTLEAIVDIEQVQHPQRLLHTAAISAVGHYDVHPEIERIDSERATDESRWRPIGRDPYLEQRLVKAILDRASMTLPRYSGDTDDTPRDNTPELIPDTPQQP